MLPKNFLEEGANDIKTCCLCGANLKIFILNNGQHHFEGNNPYPLMQHDEEAECCDICNNMYVIPLRIVIAENQDN